ncbi:Calcium-binding EF-hand family protein [Prunus dulcis]|uniref:Calcium-binding EF-hand family protein n=1 Tax=Prunus dulcis TaxID=3755 RepID=A0A4Y1RU24_PRUDU|nr:Calcium-binding EF-hand family protein [Prunus dulcis]
MILKALSEILRTFSHLQKASILLENKIKNVWIPTPAPGYGYGSTPPPGKPYAAPQPGQPGQPGQPHQHQQHQAQPYGAPAAPYGAPSAPYGAPSAPYAAPYAPEKPHQSHGSSGGGYPPSAPGYGSPFAALVPSSFPPGTDPNVVACFQMADQDGSGFIDDKELQRALSSYNQSFSLRTVHLLMYLFTQTNTRKIGNV